MAAPAFMVNQAIQYFYSLWQYGLQPSLTLETQPDGTVIASSTVPSCKPDVTLSSISQFNGSRVFVQPHHRRRVSGNGSRRRRKFNRTQNFGHKHLQPEGTLSNENASKDSNEGVVLSAEHTELTKSNSRIEPEIEPILDQMKSLSDEIKYKDDQTVRLQEELSTFKTENEKPTPQLSLMRVSCHDIPPEHPTTGPFTNLSSELNMPSPLSSMKLCRYCEEEFATMNDFLKHVEQNSYMCNNCHDYFTEKPWFSMLDLIMIDVVKGTQLYLKTSAILDPASTT